MQKVQLSSSHLSKANEELTELAAVKKELMERAQGPAPDPVTWGFCLQGSLIFLKPTDSLSFPSSKKNYHNHQDNI